MRLLRFTGHLFFLGYFLLALLLYKERALYADSAFQLFKMIQFGGFEIEASRYSTYLVKFFTVFAIQSGLSLKAVMIIFSLSYPFVYYLVFLLCVYVYKDLASALLIPMVLVLCTRASFFHHVTETHQALVYCVLFFASYRFALKREKINALHLFLNAAIVLLCFFAHPISFFVLVFVLIYSMTDSLNSKQKNFTYFLFGWMFLLALLKYLLTESNSYEGQQFENFRNGFRALMHPASIHSLRFFIGSLTWMYFAMAVLFMVTCYYLYQQKDKRKLIVYIGYLFFFWLMVVLTFSGPESLVMFEKDFMPLAFLSAMPLCLMLTKTENSRQKYLHLFLLALLLFSFGGLYKSKAFFVGRIEYMEELLSKTKNVEGQKFTIASDRIEMSRLGIPWAIAFETMMLSGLDNPTDAKTIYIYQDSIPSEINLNEATLLLGTSFWLSWNAGELNKKYFVIRNGSYREIK